MLDSLVFAFNSVAPIIFMVAIGYILGRIGFMPKDFSKLANKLVFRLFLPVMLFKNVYNIDSLSSVRFGYIIYTVCSILLLFAAAVPSVMLLTKKENRRGALIQSFFRSNYALIGIPLATMLFPAGGEGAAAASVMSAVSVPLFNILAVIGLSVFSSESDGKGKLKKVLVGIVKNPLIIGIFAGLLALAVRALFTKFGIDFRISSVSSVWNTVSYLSGIATPLALLVLGAQFEFSVISSLKREITAGVLIRCVAVPLYGLGAAYLLFKNNFTGAEFASLIAVFATPVAVSSVPMAQEMGADQTLAGQLVVFTTIVSAFTVFFASLLLKMAGIF